MARRFVFALALTAIAAIATTAFAAPLPEPSDAAGFGTALAGAVHAGRWLVVVALAINAIVWAGRRWGVSLVPWLGTKRGGAALALGSGVLTVLAVQLAAGKVDPWFFVDGLAASCTAIGQYTGSRDLATVTATSNHETVTESNPEAEG